MQMSTNTFLKISPRASTLRHRLGICYKDVRGEEGRGGRRREEEGEEIADWDRKTRYKKEKVRTKSL
jgi:hypothetical protein